MNEIEHFTEVAEYLSHPLVLIGFVLLLFFSIHRVLIKSKIIPPLRPQQGGRLLSSLLRYGFIIALIVILLGFGLEFYKSNKTIETKEPTIIAPHISTLEALGRVRTSFANELKNYELIDVIGSFYVFLKKPTLIFHRFPEWVFVFRNINTQRLIKYKITDSRVPKIPRIGGELWRKLKSGGVAYYVRQQHFPTMESRFKLKSFDTQSKLLTEWEGDVSTHAIPEVMESSTTVVLARYQIHAGEAELASTLIRMEDINQIGSIEIRKTTLDSNSFYNKLKPLSSQFISASEAVESAVRKGAKATKPDKEGRGGSGIFRLFDGPRKGEHINLPNGPYWDIPYRVGVMNPILVHAYTGDVYSLNKELKYTSDESDWLTWDEIREYQKSLEGNETKTNGKILTKQKVKNKSRNEKTSAESQGGCNWALAKRYLDEFFNDQTTFSLFQSSVRGGWSKVQSILIVFDINHNSIAANTILDCADLSDEYIEEECSSRNCN